MVQPASYSYPVTTLPAACSLQPHASFHPSPPYVRMYRPDTLHACSPVSSLVRFGFVSCPSRSSIPLRFSFSSSTHTPPSPRLPRRRPSLSFLDRPHRATERTYISPVHPAQPPPPSRDLPSYQLASFPPSFRHTSRRSSAFVIGHYSVPPLLTTFLAACARAFRHLTDSARVQVQATLPITPSPASEHQASFRFKPGRPPARQLRQRRQRRQRSQAETSKRRNLRCTCRAEACTNSASSQARKLTNHNAGTLFPVRLRRAHTLPKTHRNNSP